MVIIAVSSKFEPIYLEGMDDYDFEDLCKTIFGLLGHGDVVHMPRGADGGKDLIINHSWGYTFVECRHRPKAAVSRPDVQKLHSAAHTEGASDAIFVTSGRFSGPALDYARDVDPPMHTIDGSQLDALARKAGFRLIRKPLPGEETIYMFEPEEDAAYALLESEINAMAPTNMWGRSKYGECRSARWFEPYYRLEYNIAYRGAAAVTCVLVDGQLPSVPEKVHPSQLVVPPRGEMEVCFGAPVRSLGRWTQWVAQNRHLYGREFVLPLEEVRSFAERYRNYLAGKKGVPDENVVLKHIHRLMIPKLVMWRESVDEVVEAKALIGRKPYFLGAIRRNPGNGY